jgi:hypothetical protein
MTDSLQIEISHNNRVHIATRISGYGLEIQSVHGAGILRKILAPWTPQKKR